MNHMTAPCTFLQRNFHTVFHLSILKDFLLPDCHMCKAFFRQSAVALSKLKRMIVPVDQNRIRVRDRVGF